jgi:hypothetical protein
LVLVGSEEIMADLKRWNSHNVVAVTPLGTREANVFWDGIDEQGRGVGGFGPMTLPVYPPHPNGERLRHLRLSGGLSLHDAAELLGLSAAEFSGLEHGRMTFARDDDWRRAFEVFTR